MATHCSIPDLENPMDRGTWWAALRRVTKSQTQLKRLSTHTYNTNESESAAISVLSVQPRTKPRGASLEGTALSPTALGVEAAGGALRPRRPGQSPPSDPGAQCRQLRGARSSDEAGLGRVRATSRSNPRSPSGQR